MKEKTIRILCTIVALLLWLLALPVGALAGAIVGAVFASVAAATAILFLWSPDFRKRMEARNMKAAGQ